MDHVDEWKRSLAANLRNWEAAECVVQLVRAILVETAPTRTGGDSDTRSDDTVETDRPRPGNIAQPARDEMPAPATASVEVGTDGVNNTEPCPECGNSWFLRRQDGRALREALRASEQSRADLSRELETANNALADLAGRLAEEGRRYEAVCRERDGFAEDLETYKALVDGIPVSRPAETADPVVVELVQALGEARAALTAETIGTVYMDNFEWYGQVDRSVATIDTALTAARAAGYGEAL